MRVQILKVGILVLMTTTMKNPSHRGGGRASLGAPVLVAWDALVEFNYEAEMADSFSSYSLGNGVSVLAWPNMPGILAADHPEGASNIRRLRHGPGTAR